MELPADAADANDSAWRDELSARLSRYRTRHKPKPPRYPSLRLQFDLSPSLTNPSAASPAPTARFESASNHALALDNDPPQSPSESEIEAQSAPLEEISPPPSPRSSSAKIIEFPRFAWGPPAPPPDQLAEPVMDQPRILEVPELPTPPPALGGIMIGPVEREEAPKRPGIDIPLRSASLARRLLAGGIDGIIVGAADAVFAGIFWKVTGIRPPSVQILGMAVGISCLLWAAYQYLLIFYSGTTPGLRMAGLHLARFDGSDANRSERRWRVLASYLSAASLGMGYAWHFLDEDALCWHDRITHTYLAPKK
jgi:uncharacterized RDD family membrane protein YckC